jgi:hypothetical protein
MTFKASGGGGFFSSLFVDANARAVADDTEYVAHRSMWVAHVRSDVAKGVVRSVVLAFCEEKQFRVAYETKYDCELEHTSSQKREFLLRFGRTKTKGDHVVLGDFTCTDVGHVDNNNNNNKTGAPPAPTTNTVIDDKTHSRLAGIDNPLRSYFHLFFDELATKLATTFLLRSFDAVPLPPSVLDLHALRRARLKREQETVATRHLPGIRWVPEQRDWRASLQTVDSVARATAMRDEALRLFTEFALAENFVITQYTPSVVCELPPSDTVEQCTVKFRTSLSKSNAGLVLISYEMTPSSLELAYFVRFFDSYSKLLEHNDLLQLSSMLQRRRQLRILATSVSNAKTAADVAAAAKQKADENGDNDEEDDDEEDDGEGDNDEDDAYAESPGGMPDVPVAQPLATSGILNSGTPLPDPQRFPEEHKAMTLRAQAEAKARVSPAAVKPSSTPTTAPTSPSSSFVISPPKAQTPPRPVEQPRRAKGVIVEVLEGFVADDRGDHSLSDVSTDEDSEEVRAKQREQERLARLEAEREEARRAARQKPQYRAPAPAVTATAAAPAPPSPSTIARSRRRAKPAPPAPVAAEQTPATPVVVARDEPVPHVPDVAVAISKDVELAESKD